MKSLYMRRFSFSSLYDINSNLFNISPLDGRYAKSTLMLRDYFSEYALIKYRTKVEIEWLKFLAQKNIITDAQGQIISLSSEQITQLNSISKNFNVQSAMRVKEIESKTNHDVKAVEYFIKEKLDQFGELHQLKEYVHFLCTSEDINNLSYSLMLSESKVNLIEPEVNQIIDRMALFAENTCSTPMLARTHGQTASPTTVGKEIANFTYRINNQFKLIRDIKFPGKLNGAVGNFNAHIFSYPDQDWPQVSYEFIKSLGLEFNPYTTQIESHDQIAVYYSYLSLLNTILIGFSKDMWSYISIGYFRQRTINDEVGSSTMPHKINPIDFENCEGSLGMSNSLGQHFINKLPISRFQRDLSDSTVMRNHGVALGYSLVGWKSLQRGMGRIEPNLQNISNDLDNHWEILAEPIQQVMRKHNMENPYERLKDITRGAVVEKNSLRKYIQELDLPHEDKQRMLQLEPKDYTGNASYMAKNIRNYL